MGWRIVSAPENCWRNPEEGIEDCVACYYSNVTDNQWHGPQRCWNSQCTKMHPEDLETFLRQNAEERSKHEWD